jgi:hypothetical protein
MAPSYESWTDDPPSCTVRPPSRPAPAAATRQRCCSISASVPYSVVRLLVSVQPAECDGLSLFVALGAMGTANPVRTNDGGDAAGYTPPGGSVDRPSGLTYSASARPDLAVSWRAEPGAYGGWTGTQAIWCAQSSGIARKIRGSEEAGSLP